jgi:hypothetical protein
MRGRFLITITYESTIYTKLILTSSLVYLAYNQVNTVHAVKLLYEKLTCAQQIYASGNCQHPEKVLTNGIIALHPFESASKLNISGFHNQSLKVS